MAASPGTLGCVSLKDCLLLTSFEFTCGSLEEETHLGASAGPASGDLPTFSRGIGRKKAHITYPVSKGTLKVQVLSTLQEDDTQGSCFSWPPAISVPLGLASCGMGKPAEDLLILEE